MEIVEALIYIASILLLTQNILANESDLLAKTKLKISDETTEDTYRSPDADRTKFYFAEHFDNLEDFSSRWIKSKAEKRDSVERIDKYDGVWNVELPLKTLLPNDYGLVFKSKAKHAAIASRFNSPFVFSDKPLIVQYEANLQDGQECGGAYIKLLSSGNETTDLTQFCDTTPYTIMFGPDKCGNDIKLHFIFRHVNPLNGSITEKHCRKSKDRLDEPFKDKKPHLYQLIVRPDNTYVIRVDHKIIDEGSLLSDCMPPVNPPKEIDDPNDFKPEDWDEREKIPDPDAKKPDDWNEDESPQIPDPNASKPDGWLDDEEEMIFDTKAEKPIDWDIDMDGEWEAPLIVNPICERAAGCGLWKAPLIPNPNYKGKWRAPLIANPNYQGKWGPRKIPNPYYFEDKTPFKMASIDAVGIEMWSMSSDVLFDNIIVVDNENIAQEWASQTYDIKKHVMDKGAESFISRIIQHINNYPWMWAACFVIVIFVLAILVLLARSSKSSPCPSVQDRQTKDKTAIENNEEISTSNLNPKHDEEVSYSTGVSDNNDKKIEQDDDSQSLCDKSTSSFIQSEDGIKKRRQRKE